MQINVIIICLLNSIVGRVGSVALTGITNIFQAAGDSFRLFTLSYILLLQKWIKQYKNIIFISNSCSTVWPLSMLLDCGASCVVRLLPVDQCVSMLGHFTSKQVWIPAYWL
jgi:hypothetical protein